MFSRLSGRVTAPSPTRDVTLALRIAQVPQDIVKQEPTFKRPVQSPVNKQD